VCACRARKGDRLRGGLRSGGDPLPGFFVSVASKEVAGGLCVSADCKGLSGEWRVTSGEWREWGEKQILSDKVGTLDRCAQDDRLGPGTGARWLVSSAKLGANRVSMTGGISSDHKKL